MFREKRGAAFERPEQAFALIGNCDFKKLPHSKGSPG